MTGKDALFIGGGLGLMALALFLGHLWSNWRKRAITAAGEAFGFRRLAIGETLPMVLVPLIDRPSRTYLVILRGLLNGYEASFFDLYCTSGKNWDYQSTVLLKNPQATMPKFQLQTTQWLQASQRTCGDALEVPGRDQYMSSLRLSADDPDWARKTFLRATPELFQKLRDGKWTIEGLQHSLIVYRWGTRISARNLRQYVEQAGALAAEIFSLVGGH